MIYICMFTDGYCYYEDENCKAFLSRRSGLEWVNNLNTKLADINDCSIEDLGDYYELLSITIAKS